MVWLWKFTQKYIGNKANKQNDFFLAEVSLKSKDKTAFWYDIGVLLPQSKVLICYTSLTLIWTNRPTRIQPLFIWLDIENWFYLLKTSWQTEGY